MASNKGSHFSILSGPSLLDLMFAICDYNHPRLLVFRIEDELTTRIAHVELCVTGIKQSRVGGKDNHQEWKLVGWFMANGLETKVRDLVRFSADFDTGNRHGWLSTDFRPMSDGGTVTEDILIKWGWGY